MAYYVVAEIDGTHNCMHPADQGKSGAVAAGVALAANDDRGPERHPDGGPDAALPGAASATLSHDGATAGWDPFEVWRTRVRDARRTAPGPLSD